MNLVKKGDVFMKRLISILVVMMMLFSIAPAALADGETSIEVTAKQATFCNIKNVVLTVPAGLTEISVTVDGVEVTDYVYSGTTISFDASKYTTIKYTTITVSSAQGSGSVDVNLQSFADYMTENTFSYFGNSVIDFTKDYFGQYAMTQSSDATSITRKIDTANDVLVMAATASTPSQNVWVRMPKLSVSITGGADASDDKIGRYVDLYFYADVTTADTSSKFEIADVGGFSIGSKIFNTNGCFADTAIQYKANTPYTVKAHLDSIDGLFELYVKEANADDSTYQLIYSRTEELTGAGFKTFGLTGYATNATTKFTIDNLYYKGYVGQPGVSALSYIKDDEAVVANGTVSASASALRLDFEGNNIDDINNIYIIDAENNRINASVNAEDLNGRINARVTVTPEAFAEGDYKLVVGKGIKIDKVATSADRYIPFTVVATEFAFTSPRQGAEFASGEAVALSAVAPSADGVVFTVNGTEYAGTRVGVTSQFTATAAPIMEAGTVSCEVESFDAEGAALNYDKVYFNVTESAATTVNNINGSWVQKSGGSTSGANQNTVRTRNEEKDGIESGDNGFKMYYGTGTYDTNTYLYMQAGTTFGYSGKVVMYLDAKVDTTCDRVNLQVYGNTGSYNLASGGGRETVSIYPNLFNTNGCFHNTTKSYAANNWYEIKIVLDLDKDTKALYVDGEFLAEESLGKDYICIGSPILKLTQSNVSDRTVYAGVSVDNWGMMSEMDFPAIKSVSVDETVLSDGKVIANTASQVNLTLTRPITDLSAVKSYVNGVENTSITSALSGAVTLSDGSTVAGYNNIVFTIPERALKAGDKLSFVIGEGAGFTSAVKVSNADTTAISVTANADSEVELFVGDANKIYVSLNDIKNADGTVSTALTTINESGAEYPIFLFLAAYNENVTRLNQVDGGETSIAMGEGKMRLSLIADEDDKVFKAYCWTTDLVPIASK